MIESKFKFASFKKRSAGFIIDDLVISFFILIIYYEQLSYITTIAQFQAFANETFMSIILLKIIYHSLFIWQNGKTIGKHVMKIRVIEINTELKPTLQVSLVRAVFRIFSETLFYIGFIFASFSPMVQTLHDKFTGCIVIDE